MFCWQTKSKLWSTALCPHIATFDYSVLSRLTTNRIVNRVPPEPFRSWRAPKLSYPMDDISNWSGQIFYEGRQHYWDKVREYWLRKKAAVRPFSNPASRRTEFSFFFCPIVRARLGRTGQRPGNVFSNGVCLRLQISERCRWSPIPPLRVFKSNVCILFQFAI